MNTTLERLAGFEEDEAADRIEPVRSVRPMLLSDNANYTAHDPVDNDEVEVGPPKSKQPEETDTNDRNAGKDGDTGKQQGEGRGGDSKKGEFQAAETQQRLPVAKPVQQGVAKLAGDATIGEVQRGTEGGIATTSTQGHQHEPLVDEPRGREPQVTSVRIGTVPAAAARAAVREVANSKDGSESDDEPEAGKGTAEVHVQRDDKEHTTEVKAPTQPPKPPVPPVGPHAAGGPEDDDEDDGEGINAGIAHALTDVRLVYDELFGLDSDERQRSVAESDEPGEAADEFEDPEQAYPRFVGVIGDLRTRAAEAWSTVTSPRPIDFQISDPADPDGLENLTVRLIPPGNEQLRIAEERRHEALSRGEMVIANTDRIGLDTIVAYDSITGQMVVRSVPGKTLDSLTPEDKREISLANLADLLHGAEVMTENGIAPSSAYGAAVVWDAATGRFGVRDYVPREDTVVDQGSDIQATVDAFTGITEQLRDTGSLDREMRRASDRFRELSQEALIQHFFYIAPGIIKAAEALTIDEIRAVYAQTAPSHTGIARGAHTASEMHDLALSAAEQEDADTAEQSAAILAQRLAMLEAARQAYSEVVYGRVVDPTDSSTYPHIRTSRDSVGLLLVNDHYIQARLALAYMPVSEARIRGERVDEPGRAGVNRDLATVLDDMLLQNHAPTSRRQIDAIYGHINEVVGMTLMSRRAGVSTPLILPSSEVRRLNSGPDSGLPFDANGERREADLDWKLFAQRKMGVGDIGMSALYLSELRRMEHPPELPPINTHHLEQIMVEYTAGLLRAEGLGMRELTSDETAYLNRLQTQVWGRITSTITHGRGVRDLRKVAGV